MKTPPATVLPPWAITLILLMFLSPLAAQLHRGGSPLGTSTDPVCIEMEPLPPARQTRTVESENRPHQPFVFAHKFKTDLSPDQNGTWSLLPDGGRVWHLALKSSGAQSINLLFENYRLPQGACLYLYTPSHSHTKGAFTSENNSPEGILPTAPVEGDEVIVEYQEPKGVEFPGTFTITELNHDTVGVLRSFPPLRMPGSPDCQPNTVCFPEWKKESQAVGIVIVDGQTAGTGTLVNNTSNDGTPYFLTAAHIFDAAPTFEGYKRLAQRSLFFFNYQSPSCTTDFRGPEEMSIASAEVMMGEQSLDFILLKLSSVPPPHFRPYYAGWNRSLHAPPYTGIHQPNVGIQKWNRTDSKPTPYTPNFGEIGFVAARNCYLMVERWAVGITEGGSSGSPLFDSQHRAVGVLTGGYSYCPSPIKDFYARIDSAWAHYSEPERQLKPWLDPLNSNATVCDGMDPYAASGTTAIRRSNIGATTPVVADTLQRPDSGMTFGKNSLKTDQYAERFRSTGKCTLHGVYLVTPPWKSSYNNGSITLYIYKGEEQPDRLLTSFPVRLTYLSKENVQSELSTTHPTDNYIALPQPLEVEGTFFVGYSADQTSTASNGFTVYNAHTGNIENSAFVKISNRWLSASQYSPYLRSTALWIDPVITPSSPVAVEQIDEERRITISYRPQTRQLEIRNLHPAKELTLHLYTADGIEKMRTLSNKELTVVSLHALPAGTYIVRCSNRNESFARKIVIE